MRGAIWQSTSPTPARRERRSTRSMRHRLHSTASSGLEPRSSASRSTGWPGAAPTAVAASSPALRTLRSRGNSAWEARLSVQPRSGPHEAGTAPTRTRESRTGARPLRRVGPCMLQRPTLGSKWGAPVFARVTTSAALPNSTGRSSSLTDWAACWLICGRQEALVALRLLPEARRGPRSVRGTIPRRAEAADSLNQGRLDAAPTRDRRRGHSDGDHDGNSRPRVIRSSRVRRPSVPRRR